MAVRHFYDGDDDCVICIIKSNKCPLKWNKITFKK